VGRSAREQGWPTPPEPLPGPVVDNHTHLEAVLEVDDGAGAGATSAHPAAQGVAGAGLPPFPPRSLADHLALAAAVGVATIVQIGCDLESADWTARAVREHPALVGGVAIHPNEAVLHAGVHELAPDGLAPAPRPRHATSLEDAIAHVARLAAADPRIRVIGESGLDHFRAGERGREVQRQSFRAHIALAKELDLVLQIHDRDAHADVLDVLERDGAPARTVFHCFSGDAELARRCVASGWFLSFAGPVTFRANAELREAVRVTPISQLLVETDAPYLTPAPHRGRPNAPYQIPHTVRTIAAVLELPVAEACAGLNRTAARLYDL
jgi:TatD DNase family protein